LAAGVAVFALSGCATVGTVSKPVELPDSPASLRSWSLDGRIGAQATDKAWQASLYWEHAPAQDRLRISGPLSQGLVSIIVQKDLIYVNEGNGAETLSHDPDAWLRQRLGFAVPLTSLRFWVLGIPDPDHSFAMTSAGEDVAGGFRQAGWRIYPEQVDNVDGWLLPRKIRAEGPGVKLKILADTWSLNDR
jgi:outer membrane lipoprotein LolB